MNKDQTRINAPVALGGRFCSMADISFTIKRRKGTRRLSIRVTLCGVVVTIPQRVSLRQAEAFFQSHLAWVQKTWTRLQSTEHTLWAGTTAEYYRYRARAKKVIAERVKHWAALHGFSYRRISIKNHRSKWGSCSKTGNLNFNYRLIFLPLKLIDYVVVHELCHLRHLNHSKKFWESMNQILSNGGELRHELRTYRV